jgi:restriction endonuclease S subunit
MKKRLKDIADFRTGYLFRGKVNDDSAGNVRVVQIKDVDAARQIDVGGLDRVHIDKPASYQVQAGDVLFLGRGHRLYATVVPEVEPETIATGYFFILRPRHQLVSPEFLAWSLNDSIFQEALRPYQRGSHVPMVSRSDVEEIRINVPPLDVQQQILTLNQLARQELQLTTAIAERRSLLVQAVSQQLMRD